MLYCACVCSCGRMCVLWTNILRMAVARAYVCRWWGDTNLCHWSGVSLPWPRHYLDHVITLTTAHSYTSVHPDELSTVVSRPTCHTALPRCSGRRLYSQTRTLSDSHRLQHTAWYTGQSVVSVGANVDHTAAQLFQGLRWSSNYGGWNCVSFSTVITKCGEIVRNIHSLVLSS